MMDRRAFLTATLGAAAFAASLPASAHHEGFEEAARAGASILVHITAPWCEVCQIQKPIVAELLARPDFKALKHFEFDFDTEKELLADFRVTRQSTMIVFKGEEEIDRQVGETDPAAIEAFLRRAL